MQTVKSVIEQFSLILSYVPKEIWADWGMALLIICLVFAVLAARGKFITKNSN